MELLNEEMNKLSVNSPFGTQIVSKISETEEKGKYTLVLIKIFCR
jgi:hypothetical protein